MVARCYITGIFLILKRNVMYNFNICKIICVKQLSAGYFSFVISKLYWMHINNLIEALKISKGWNVLNDCKEKF